jgi:hypothetical protein
MPHLHDGDFKGIISSLIKPKNQEEVNIFHNPSGISKNGQWGVKK